MNRDEEISLEILEEIKKERKISNPYGIKVTAKEGVVTLGGIVSHYMEQLAAVEAAERIRGVQGVVQEIEVVLPEASKRDDQEIARAACNAIEHNSVIPAGRVMVLVHDGRVTLTGEVPEAHQKIEAGATVSRILGVKRVTNNITVRPVLKPYDVTLHIERSFQHMAAHHAQDIHVEIKGNKVILSGEVRAWIEIEAAEEAAHEVPGVVEVENRLEITPLLAGKEKPPVAV